MSALRYPKFWILHSLSFDWRLVFHFGISWLPLRYSLLYHLITLWYLLITPLFFPDYPFGILWLRHLSHWTLCWYFQITPLGSSDYPFGNFWLRLWYLLITPLVSFDYVLGPIGHSVGIFRSLHWYIQITHLVSSYFITHMVFSDCSFDISWLLFSIV